MGLFRFHDNQDGHTNIVRLLSMSETDEAMTIYWGGKKREKAKTMFGNIFTGRQLKFHRKNRIHDS